MGTWNLKACPMDGGSIALEPNGKVATTWRRENTIYVASPGSMEQKMGEGRAASLAQSTRGHYLVWQQNQHIVALSPNAIGAVTIGNGTYPRVATLQDQGAISVWEADGQIVARRLE
jgi:hypothetical protein